jgi:hypothetical protein
MYNGRDASNEFVGVDTRADGTVYPNYSRVLEDKDADIGAFPDTTVQGWVIFELPENFDATDAVLTILTDGGTEDTDTLEWRLSSG